MVGDELRYCDHAFPLAPGTGAGSPVEVHDRQHYRLVRLAARRTPGSTTGGSSPSTPLAGGPGRGPSGLRGHHVEIRRWFDEGLVDGLRVDHPDGLRDPAGYLDDLAELTGGAYVLVEKILEPGEELPPVVGHRRDHRVRRARATSTGC